MKRAISEDAAPPVKAMTVACKFCGRPFKPRGLKLHQNKCPKKNGRTPTDAFTAIDPNCFATVLSFLGNQSLVKLQSITGARYPGSSPLASSICCPCENDELIIANGRCLACNQANDAAFRETITTAQAKKLCAGHDINDMSHEAFQLRRHRGRFLYADVQRYAEAVHGSKMVWLESLAVRVHRNLKARAAKERNETEYLALLSSFSDEFVEFIQQNCSTRRRSDLLRLKSERYDAMVAALTDHDLTLRDDCTGRCCHYILTGFGQADELATAIIQKRKDEKRVAELVKTLPSDFVDYVERVSPDESAVAAQLVRYNSIVTALATRGLELQRNSILCRPFICKAIGKVDDIVDAVEEMKFLLEHTEYAGMCRSQNPHRRWRQRGDYDYDSFDAEEEAKNYNSALIAVQERVKKSIREQFVRDPQGLELPRKWALGLPSHPAWLTKDNDIENYLL